MSATLCLHAKSRQDSFVCSTAAISEYIHIREFLRSCTGNLLIILIRVRSISKQLRYDAHMASCNLLMKPGVSVLNNVTSTKSTTGCKKLRSFLADLIDGINSSVSVQKSFQLLRSSQYLIRQPASLGSDEQTLRSSIITALISGPRLEARGGSQS
jgi:hypothetical protein